MMGDSTIWFIIGIMWGIILLAQLPHIAQWYHDSTVQEFIFVPEEECQDIWERIEAGSLYHEPMVGWVYKGLTFSNVIASSKNADLTKEQFQYCVNHMPGGATNG